MISTMTLEERLKISFANRLSLNPSTLSTLCERCFAHDDPKAYFLAVQAALKDSRIPDDEQNAFAEITISRGIAMDVTDSNPQPNNTARYNIARDLLLSGFVTSPLDRKALLAFFKRENMAFSDIISHPTLHSAIKAQALSLFK